MIILSITTVIMFGALLVFAVRVRNRNMFNEQRQEIKTLLSNIYLLGSAQRDNLLALRDTVEHYADDEHHMLQKLTVSAQALGAVNTPGKVEAAAKTASGALAALYKVAKYYPPLVARRDYLEQEEAANSGEVALADEINVYNAAVANYNTRIAHQRLRAKADPFQMIAR